MRSPESRRITSTTLRLLRLLPISLYFIIVEALLPGTPGYTGGAVYIVSQPINPFINLC